MAEHEQSACCSIILVTLNYWKRTFELLCCLRKYSDRPYRLVLIDNGSTDETWKNLVSNSYDWLLPNNFLLVRRNNEGLLAGALNEALYYSVGQFYVYLCARGVLILRSGWMQAAQQYFQAFPRCGLAGHVQDAGNLDLLPSKMYPQSIGKEWKKRRLTHVQGGICFFRPEAVKQVGLLNEHEYPLGRTDCEYSCRMQMYGWDLGALPFVFSTPGGYHACESGLVNTVYKTVAMVHHVVGHDRKVLLEAMFGEDTPDEESSRSIYHATG